MVDNVGNNFALHAKDRTYNFIVDSLPDKGDQSTLSKVRTESLLVSWMKALQQQIKQVRAPKRWSKTGFMKKRGGNWKTWKMRWFCLDDQQLYYFKKVLVGRAYTSSFPACLLLLSPRIQLVLFPCMLLTLSPGMTSVGRIAS